MEQKELNLIYSNKIWSFYEPQKEGAKILSQGTKWNIDNLTQCENFYIIVNNASQEKYFAQIDKEKLIGSENNEIVRKHDYIQFGADTVDVVNDICYVIYVFLGSLKELKMGIEWYNESQGIYYQYKNERPKYRYFIKTIIVKNRTISGGEFMCCPNLESVEFAEDCDIKSIGIFAFMYCINLKKITLPVTVEKIYSETFEGCVNLESITVDKDNKVYDSRENCNAIIETATNKIIRGCKNTVIPHSVKKIGRRSFSGCGIERIEIPNNITTIERIAFLGCSNLKEVILSNRLKSIKSNTFNDCSNLGKIVLPNSVQRIGHYAFWYCENLKSIVMPKNLKTICEGAFEYCKNLRELEIPKSVEYLGSDCLGTLNLDLLVLPEKFKDKATKEYLGFESCKEIKFY